MEQKKQHKPDLSMPVQFVKGVGPARAAAFARVGVKTLADLLEYFPRDWKFMTEPIKINQLLADHQVCIAGIVESVDFFAYRRPQIFEAYITDETGSCRIIWFYGRFLQNKITVGSRIVASGKVSLYKHQLQLTNPDFAILGAETEQNYGNVGGPVYPATEGLTSRQIKKITRNIVPRITRQIPEFFNRTFLKRTELIPRKDAYWWIHFPPDEEKLAQAKRRLKYDELFLMQLGLAVGKHKKQNLFRAPMIACTDRIDSRIRRRFPFLLTGDRMR